MVCPEGTPTRSPASATLSGVILPQAYSISRIAVLATSVLSHDGPTPSGRSDMVHFQHAEDLGVEQVDPRVSHCTEEIWHFDSAFRADMKLRVILTISLRDAIAERK